MLFIAAGFVLTFGGSGLIFIVSLVFSIPPLVVVGATQFIEIFGMGTILYGFIMPAMEWGWRILQTNPGRLPYSSH